MAKAAAQVSSHVSGAIARELLESSLPLLFWRIQTVHAFDMLTHVCGMASAFVGAVLSFALVLAVFVGSRVELGLPRGGMTLAACTLLDTSQGPIMEKRSMVFKRVFKPFSIIHNENARFPKISFIP
jgi:hypothetical protein